MEITVLGIDSIESKMLLFPNPVRNWLNICYDQPFSYILFNNIGQQVRVGKAEGDTLIECRTLPRGVYILQIATETQVFKKKIIVR